MIKFVRSLLGKNIWDRVSSIEEKIIVKEKYDESENPFCRMMNMAKGPDDTIGNRVQMLEDAVSRSIPADKVNVVLKYSCVDDEDGSLYKSGHSMKLQDVIAVLLDHCGLEILPPDNKPGIVVSKKND